MAVGVSVAVRVLVAVRVAVTDDVRVSDGATVTVRVGVAVLVRVATSVRVAVNVGLDVGVGVAVIVFVTVGVDVIVLVEVIVAVTVRVDAGVAVAFAPTYDASDARKSTLPYPHRLFHAGRPVLPVAPAAYRNSVSAGISVTPPAPVIVSVKLSFRILTDVFVPIRRLFTCAVVSVGFAWNRRATIPATCGEAMLVP